MKLKYAVEQRLRFIDFLVHQYGTINRTALMDYFGVSVQQAAKDFKDYMRIAPGNIKYSLSEKTCLRQPLFARVWA